ncbi:MAG: hypothetical protein WBC17_06375, partial [Mycobacterium sp.]
MSALADFMQPRVPAWADWVAGDTGLPAVAWPGRRISAGTTAFAPAIPRRTVDGPAIALRWGRRPGGSAHT